MDNSNSDKLTPAIALRLRTVTLGTVATAATKEGLTRATRGKDDSGLMDFFAEGSTSWGVLFS